MRLMLAFVLTSALLGSAPCLANPPSPEEVDTLNRMKQEFTNIDINRIGVISQQLQLTDQEAKQFWPLYQNHLHRKIQLRDQQLQTLATYTEKLNAGSLDPRDATALLAFSMLYERDQIDNRKSLILGLGKVLGPTQQLRLYQLELLLDTEIRQGLLRQIPLAK